MDTVDPIRLLVPLTHLVMLAIEVRRPARSFPPRPGWRRLGAGFVVLIATVGSVVPLLLPLAWMEMHRWLDGSRLGIVADALAGWLVLSFLAFAWHRSAHAFSPLWRFGDQMHHAPQRLDISGATVFHPAEMVVQALIQLFVTVTVTVIVLGLGLGLGLGPAAASLVAYVVAFHGMFQHWNVRTPQWLGHFIQRPESHCVHHRQGLHAYNDSDFPLWDMLFGSFRNPAEFRAECGFEAPADRRLGAMLIWQGVNAPLYGDASGDARSAPAAQPAQA